MDKRAFVLLALVVISALSVVGLRHQSRLTFADLQTLQTERDNLNIEWGRLLLEQGAWSQHQRVEVTARTQLGMRTPGSREVVLIKLNSQLAMRAGATN